MKFKVKVELSRLVRESVTVVVEAPSEEYLQEHLHDVYEDADDHMNWRLDEDWGCDEGTHSIIGPAAKRDKVDLKMTTKKKAKR